jgi:hypothetical protein
LQDYSTPSRREILVPSYVRALEKAAPFSARVNRQAEVHPLLHEFSALDADQLQGFGLLFWKLLGFTANDPAGMRAFRRFQSGLPMPNCAVYELDGPHGGRWSLRANDAAMRQSRWSKWRGRRYRWTPWRRAPQGIRPAPKGVRYSAAPS